jgi:hypothetical protein
MSNGGSITARVSLQGADQVRAELATLGPAGGRAGRELDRALREPGPGLRALNAGAAEARRGVDGLAASTGPLGAGLSSIGPVGLAAAAALAVVAAGIAFAVREARAAVAFADELEDSAAKINVGTDALQEYRYAMAEVGGEAADADRALDGFQKKLGEAMAGGRSVKWFERLGFSRSDLGQFQSTEEALEAVIDKIAGLGTEAERAAVSEKLGLGPMIPLIREGTDRIDALRAQARELGLVMDEEMVRRGAQVARQMEVTSQVIDLQLKQAFVDLGPVLLDAMRLVAQLARALADMADQWRDIETKTRRGLEIQMMSDGGDRHQMDERYGGRGQMARQTIFVTPVDGYAYTQGPDPLVRGIRRGVEGAIGKTWVNAQEHYDALGWRMGRTSRELIARQEIDTDPPGDRTSLVDVSGGGRGGSDRTADEGRRALERLDALELAAKRDHLREFEGFADTAQSRAHVARGMLDLDIQQRDAELAEMRAAIEKAGLMTEEVRARFDQQALLNAEIDAAKRAAIDAREAEALSRQRRDAEDAWLQVQGDILSVASASARTSEERRRIELDLLEIAQRRRRAELEAAIAAESDAKAKLRLVMTLADLGKLDAAERREVERQNGNPVEQWFDAQPQSWGEFKELMQGETLDALDDLNRGLIDAVKNAESFGEAMSNMGDVAVNALMRVVEALLEVWLQKQIIEPMVSGIWGRDGHGGAVGSGVNIWDFARNILPGMFGGRAKGGDQGASGTTIVGEYGPELLHLPVGSRVEDHYRTAQRLMAPGGGSTAHAANDDRPLQLDVRVINQTSEPVRARQVRTPDGLDLILQPAVEGAVQRMGATGQLKAAADLTPKLKKR